MILDIFIYIIAVVLLLLGKILPEWQPWPTQLLEAVQWFGSSLNIFNVFVPVGEWVLAAIWFLTALSAYFFARLVIMVINFFRGSGAIEV